MNSLLCKNFTSSYAKKVYISFPALFLSNKSAKGETEYAARLPLKNLEDLQVYNIVSRTIENRLLVQGRDGNPISHDLPEAHDKKRNKLLFFKIN